VSSAGVPPARAVEARSFFAFALAIAFVFAFASALAFAFTLRPAA